jgi:SAM-dependent methyltransferase
MLLDSGDDEDLLFDDQLPQRMQAKSSIHFTPVAVARYAARLLVPQPGMTVLDVGSGPGKFCVIAATEVPHATFVGVELRPYLARMATRLATRLAVANVRFHAGDALDLDWSAFDAFYLYNPFAEQMHDATFLLDRTLALDPALFVRYVLGVRKRLAAARIGTRVVTYHGFGGPLPLGYELIEQCPIGTDRLELWIKTHDAGVVEDEDDGDKA